MMSRAIPTSVETNHESPYVNSLQLHCGRDNQLSSRQRAVEALTDREGTIIVFIGAGRSNKEIARELGVTPETIKTHLKRIFLKLSACNRTQAFARAQSLGLVS